MLSEWCISSNGEMIKSDIIIHHRDFHILHIDDHSLFGDGLKKALLPSFPNSIIYNITDGDRAVTYLKHQLKKVRIDLIITDVNHPGMRGDDLVRWIRDFEEEHQLKRTPIMFITMMDTEEMMNRCPYLADKYLSKAAEAPEIIEAMEEILY